MNSRPKAAPLAPPVDGSGVDPGHPDRYLGSGVRRRATRLHLPLFAMSLSILALILLPLPPVLSQPLSSFSANQQFSTGASWPVSMVAEDLNLDLATDLICFHSRESRLTYVESQGDGTFRNGRRIDTFNGAPPNYAGCLEGGDFNGDGRTDLLVNNPIVDQIALLLSRGGGSFLDLRVAAPIEATAVAVGHFNADEDLDFAAISDAIYVYKGNGRGSFSQAGNFGFLNDITDAGCGDMDRDGFNDLILCGNNVTIYRGGISGTFYSPRAFAVGGPCSELAVLDLNRDQFLDVATVVTNPPTLVVLLGDGFGSLNTSGSFPLPPDVRSIALADFNFDGNVDVAAASFSNLQVRILHGDGTGGFFAPTDYPTSIPPTQVIVGDFDGDCRPDFAVGSNQGSSIDRRLNRTAFDYRRGNVDAASGTIKDVLFVNNSSGRTTGRQVRYGVLSPFEIQVLSPPAVPSAQSAPFALYAWSNFIPDRGKRLPFGIGCIAMPIPLTGGSPQPSLIWNNARHTDELGVPDRPSSPAPTIVVQRPGGPRRGARFYIQGVIFDPQSGAPIPASVTNGIEAIPVFN